MEKEFRTSTYGTNVPLRLNSGQKIVTKSGIEVKAKVNLDSGEVTFFIDENDLKKLQSDDK